MVVAAPTIATTAPNTPNPTNNPIAAPPMAAPCRNAKSEPAATLPIEACHAAATLPIIGPCAPKPMAFKIAGTAKQSPKVMIPASMTASSFLWASTQAVIDFTS